MSYANLKIAWRHLRKNRGFTLINLLGLAFGLAAALAVVLYVQDELSYESFHERADRIVRVNLEAEFDGQRFTLDAAPNAAAPMLKQRLPEVREAVRVFPHKFGETAFVRAGEQNFAENNFYWADSTLLDVFTLRLQAGRPQDALDRVNTVLLSASTARRYFGDDNPVGKTIRVDGQYDLEVSGVFADLPANTHYHFDLIGSFQSLNFGKPEGLSWGNASFKTFLLLNSGVTPAAVEAKIQQAIAAEVPEDRRWFTLKLQPLRDIHLYSDSFTVMKEPYGDIRQVRILIGLAVLLLLTACINYMNLATAKSQQRSREVAVSKTLGATAWGLARQFYLETALLALAGIVLSIGLLGAALPFFNQLSGKELSLAFLGEAWFWLTALAVWAAVTAMAGAYPAAYLSSFRPMEVLRQNLRSGSRAGLVRQGLVVFQFCVSTGLIISTLVFYQQLNFIRNKKLGYNPEQVIALRVSGIGNGQQLQTLEKEIDRLAPVLGSALSQAIPGGTPSGRTLRRPNAPEGEGGAELWSCRAQPDLFSVLNLPILAGRTLSIGGDQDSIAEVVLNRKAVEYLGYTPDEAIGRPVEADLGPAQIVGVVEDFHFGSLRNEIGMYAFHNRRSEWLQYLLVKLKGDQVFDAVDQLRSAFNRVVPDIAFDYTFLDDHLASLYATERRLAGVIFVFAGLAVFVGCLGLFALVAFAAEQRTKEIGVRKVLGATVGNIVALLSRDFLKLVVWSILLAVPLTWWAMHRWLANFAYHVDLHWWVFALAGLLAVLIALVTVGFQGLRAALINPVEALRDE